MADMASVATMNNRSTLQSQWLSPLGASAALFLIGGVALSLALGIQWTIIPPILTVQVLVVPVAVILGWIGQSSRFFQR